MAPRPPSAARKPVTAVRHGISRVDDYDWLRAENWREVVRDPTQLPPDIRDHLDAENAYSEAMLADTAELQEALFAEMTGRLNPDDGSVPVVDGPYAYAIRYSEAAQHPMLVREPREGGAETVLLDANLLADGQGYFRLGQASHSPDHRLLAYAVDFTGSEYFDLILRDLDTGRDLPEIIPGTTGASAWAADGRTVYYTRLDANHRPAQVLRHRVGTDPADDELVHDDPDPGLFLSVGLTHSRRYLVIESFDHQSSEVRIVDAEDPTAKPELVAPRAAAEKYSVEHRGDRLFILTNQGDAEDFKIVTAPVDAPGRENWRELVPHRPGRLILGITAFRDFLVRLEREDSVPRLVVRHLDSGDEHVLTCDEEAYSLAVLEGYEFDSTILRYAYSSPATPGRVYDYDMAARSRILRKEDLIPSGHDPADYAVRLVHAPAPDGEEIPVILFHRHDTKLDGTAPTLLFGYGAYGVTTPASFGVGRLSLVDRGWVYAIAHIRGSQAKGFRWYAEGRREKKANSFTDYIAAARHLVETGVTAERRIVGWGASAGGLVMGAAANMAPHLFAGIIADVPFVDVLNTMLDETLPLTPPEWPEWGNPLTSAADYATIAAYSPYDNIRPQAYPAILALAGIADPRVTYWEPTKWVARLRALGTGERPILLHTNMEAGHGGPSGRFNTLRETALATAFALRAISWTQQTGEAERQAAPVSAGK